MMASPDGDSRLTILGGGIAGLSVGHYARRAGLPFTILESRPEIGGNCRTIEHGGFRFDTGAHRFHDKDASQTRELRALLGDEVREISVPSRIHHRGRFIAFPLSPIDLARQLGLRSVSRAAFEVLRARLASRRGEINFETLAVRNYGRTIAELFLLGYSHKLWGVPPRGLSPVVSGSRLKGLTAAAMLREMTGGRKSGAKHLDGNFFYPRSGIRAIPDRLGESCGPGSILTRSRVTRVVHDDRAIRAVEINGRELRETGRVIGTLPLVPFLEMFDPAPPPEILGPARKLKHRNLLLCALFLDTPSVSPFASFYFPDPRIPFSRVYEPKARSASMAPPGKTAVVAEIPCWPNDPAWREADGALLEKTSSELSRIGFIRTGDVIGGLVVRLDFAYPVIGMETEALVRPIFRYLARFGNLALSGRCARFKYAHIHDLMRRGQEIVAGGAFGRIDGR
jgi:protoporphyrinogen oxidase